MVDVFTKQRRSEIMGRITSKDTQPERVVRRLLHRMGMRYRLYRSDLPGKPDIVLPRWKTVIFVHGCFWHRHPGCRRASIPSTRVAFWQRKLAANVARDAAAQGQLRELGWRVLVVWQCELSHIDEVMARITDFITRQ
jgi:DNA mismatch endonuclease, patch repair protein